MFQQSERWYQLINWAGHRIDNGYDHRGVGECLQALELLVRTESQAAELEVLIETAQEVFGDLFEDYLHE